MAPLPRSRLYATSAVIEPSVLVTRVASVADTTRSTGDAGSDHGPHATPPAAIATAAAAAAIQVDARRWSGTTFERERRCGSPAGAAGSGSGSGPPAGACSTP